MMPTRHILLLPKVAGNDHLAALTMSTASDAELSPPAQAAEQQVAAAASAATAASREESDTTTAAVSLACFGGDLSH
jgi:hypothetical protein